MSQQFSNIGGYGSLPPVIKNLIIINGLMFLLALGMKRMNIDLNLILGLFPWESSYFRPWQPITYLFIHPSFMNLLFGMLGLWLMGTTVERVLGSQKFLLLYFVSGIGAALCQMIVMHFYLADFMSLAQARPELFSQLANTPYSLINTPNFNTSGTSGAIYGVLFAFAYMFPNMVINLYFLFPIKAKYFIAIIVGIVFLSGLGDNSANSLVQLAYLGGMLFAFFLLTYWKRKGKLY